MAPINRLKSLTWAEVRVLVFATLLLLATHLALLVLPFRTVRVVFTPSLAVVKREHGADLKQLAWAVKVIGRRLLGDKPCLTQALVLHGFYRRRGYDAVLRMGVKKGQDGKLLAHAWVEHKGRVVVGGWRSPFMYASLGPVQTAPIASSDGKPIPAR